jgi:hypothetical protein
VTEYRYARRALAADYARGGIGFLLSAGPLMFVYVGRTVTAVLVALAVTFVVYGFRTACRGITRVRVDDDGIAIEGLRRSRLSWYEITEMRLSYYSTKRDGRGGWMQLRLNGPCGAMRFESSIDGFADIAQRAYLAAGARGISPGPATLANLRLLGVRLSEAS